MLREGIGAVKAKAFARKGYALTPSVAANIMPRDEDRS